MADFSVYEGNAPQQFGVVASRGRCGQDHRLIAHRAHGLVHLAREKASGLGVAFGGVELRRAGFSVSDMCVAGFSIPDLLSFGYNENHIWTAGFSHADLVHTGLRK
jgi:hypothetical protein